MNNKTMEQLAKEEQAKYMREWRKQNKDKVKHYNHAYWLRRAKEKIQQQEEGENND